MARIAKGITDRLRSARSAQTIESSPFLQNNQPIVTSGIRNAVFTGSLGSAGGAQTIESSPLLQNNQPIVTSGLESAGGAQTIEDSVDLITERQIEEREEVLTERGGSSSRTQVFGDEEDEELGIGNSLVLLGFDTDFISDGFYQSLSPRFGNSNSEVRARSANSVLINRTILYAGRKFVFDYTPISRFPKLNVAPLTREIIYSDLEKNKLYTILNKDKTNKTQAREAIESYLNLASQEEIEDSIITNRFENKKKIKLSSF